MFTKVSAIGTILRCVGSMLVLPVLSFYLNLPDPLIGWISSCSIIAMMFFTAIARTSDVYVYSVIFGLLGDVVSSTIRSIMSKQVEKDELGRVYSLLGCLEGVQPLALTPLFTLIYNSTLDHPSTVYFIRTGLGVLVLFSFIFITSLERRKVRSGPTEKTPLINAT